MDSGQEAQFIVFDRKEFLRWWGQGEIGGTAHRIKSPDEVLGMEVTRRPWAGVPLKRTSR